MPCHGKVPARTYRAFSRKASMSLATARSFWVQTTHGRSVEKAIGAGAPKQTPFPRAAPQCDGEVKRGTFARRKKSTSSVRLSQLSLCSLGARLVHTSAERGPAAILTRCPRRQLHAAHASTVPCPLPIRRRRCLSSHTLSRPSWLSAVFPPRSTTAPWPPFLAPTRHYLPHIPPRSRKDASETA
jgi:hypothetical protein